MDSASELATMLEINSTDIAVILNSHQKTVDDDTLEKIVEQVYEEISGTIVDGIRYYDSLDAQTESAYSDIEDWMMEEGIIPKGNKFYTNEAADRLENEEIAELED